MKNLVSVVVPTYGSGEYVCRAVDSVLSQTYQNIEVIVVDDNGLGTKNQLKTAEQMRKYERNPKVRYICHEVNKNGSAARNTGAKNATGEYVALLDDDDEFYLDNIEKHVEAISSLADDYAMTYCGTRCFFGDCLDHESHPTQSGDLLFDALIHNVDICSSSLLIKRSAWDTLVGFDESFRRHQDWEFVARVCANYKVKAIDHIGVKRNLVMRNSPKNADIALEYRKHYLDKMMPYIERFSPDEQKFIISNNLMDICVYYLKENNYKGFLQLYFSIKPGLYGIKYLYRRFRFARERGKI